MKLFIVLFHLLVVVKPWICLIWCIFVILLDHWDLVGTIDKFSELQPCELNGCPIIQLEVLDVSLNILHRVIIFIVLTHKMPHVVLLHVPSSVEIEPVLLFNNAHVVFPDLVCLWPWRKTPRHDELPENSFEIVSLFHLEPDSLKVFEDFVDILILALILSVHLADIANKRPFLSLHNDKNFVEIDLLPLPIN